MTPKETIEKTQNEKKIFRELAIPLSAFEILQDLKRRYGFTRNVDAITYALMTVENLKLLEQSLNEPKYTFKHR
jgi:hypothetical protein|tara:strand:- start:199 stop:420 length:222 start_codon:yes stop_codon:yes gene_type:complete